MLKNKTLIFLLTLILVVGVYGFFIPHNENNGSIDAVSAATVQVGDEIGRQKVCVIIETLTVIDTDDLDEEINVIDDEDDLDAGTISIYSNDDVKITAYHDEDAYTNPEPFENAVALFEVRVDASPPVGLGYVSLLGADSEENAVDITGNLKGVSLENVPVQYNIGLEWDDPISDGTYCTDVVFTLEEFN